MEKINCKITFVITMEIGQVMLSSKGAGCSVCLTVHCISINVTGINEKELFRKAKTLMNHY